MLAAVVIAAATADAQACKVIGPQSALSPPNGAIDVPADVLITGPSTLTATGPTGEPLPLVSVTDPSFLYVAVFRPAQPLPAGQVVTLSDGRHFTVAADGVGRGVPHLTIANVMRSGPVEDTACTSSSCHGLRSVSFTVTGDDPSVAPTFDVRIGPANALDHPEQTVAFVKPSEPSAGGAVHVSFPSFSSGDVVVLVPRDLAGRSGDPLPPVPFDEQGGCALGGAPFASVPWALLGAFALALRVRARWPRRPALPAQVARQQPSWHIDS